MLLFVERNAKYSTTLILQIHPMVLLTLSKELLPYSSHSILQRNNGRMKQKISNRQDEQIQVDVDFGVPKIILLQFFQLIISKKISN